MPHKYIRIFNSEKREKAYLEAIRIALEALKNDLLVQGSNPARNKLISDLIDYCQQNEAASFSNILEKLNSYSRYFPWGSVTKDLLNYFIEDLEKIEIEHLLHERKLAKHLFDSEHKIALEDALEEHVRWAFEHIYSVPYPWNHPGQGIARTNHGIQHVCRAALEGYAWIRLYQKYNPSLHFSDEDIKLILLAIIFHDAGRMEEGLDKWDLQSALMLYYYLTRTLKIQDKAKAKQLSEAIANKDPRPEGFFQLSEEDAQGQVWWKVIPDAENHACKNNPYIDFIHDADCGDIIRIYGDASFDRNYLNFHQQYASKSPQADQEEADLIRAISALISAQGDHPSSTDIAIKQQYECGDCYKKSLETAPEEFLKWIFDEPSKEILGLSESLHKKTAEINSSFPSLEEKHSDEEEHSDEEKHSDANCPSELKRTDDEADAREAEPENAGTKAVPEIKPSTIELEVAYENAKTALNKAIADIPDKNVKKKFTAVRDKIIQPGILRTPEKNLAAITAMTNTTAVLTNTMSIDDYLAYAKSQVEEKPDTLGKAVGVLMIVAGVALAALSSLIFAGTLGGGLPAAIPLGMVGAGLVYSGLRFFRKSSLGLSRTMIEAGDAPSAKPLVYKASA